jgi:hypothetical protein
MGRSRTRSPPAHCAGVGFRVRGLGSKGSDIGSRVQGLGESVDGQGVLEQWIGAEGLGYRYWGFRVSGLGALDFKGFRVLGEGFRVCGFRVVGFDGLGFMV